MADSKGARRPPSIGLSRPPVAGAGTATAARAHLGDAEELREEHARLRSALAALKKEAAELRELMRAKEKESFRRDQLLQELLANAKVGPQASGEALDQLREDLQALLQFKRRAHDARLRLEEKQQKVIVFKTELKVANVSDMEDDVLAAKGEAKAIAVEYSDVNVRTNSKALEHQKRAQALLRSLEESEAALTRTQRELATLQDERSALEKATADHMPQIQQLQDKCMELDAQIEQCEQKLSDAEYVQDQHNDLLRECDEKLVKLTKARQDALKRQHEEEAGKVSAASLTIACPTGASSRIQAWEIAEQILQPGFQPLPLPGEGDAGQVQLLFWRCRQALEALPCSGYDALAAEDLDSDGRLSPEEFATSLRRLGVRGCGEEAVVKRLVQQLNPCLISPSGHLSIVDFLISLPLQSRPPPPPELADALQALVWACRRNCTSERDVRSRCVAWLADPRTDLEVLSAEFCQSIGLDLETASTIGRGVCLLREGFGSHLPSWSTRSKKARASMLSRFARTIAERRDVLLPLLAVEMVDLDVFIKIMPFLPETWTQDELEEIAIVSESQSRQRSIKMGSAPVVHAGRLARSAQPGGLAKEFPEVSDDCLPKALEAIDLAALAPPKQARPEARAAPQAQVPKAAAAPPSPSPSAGGASSAAAALLAAPVPKAAAAPPSPPPSTGGASSVAAALLAAPVPKAAAAPPSPSQSAGGESSAAAALLAPPVPKAAAAPPSPSQSTGGESSAAASLLAPPAPPPAEETAVVSEDEEEVFDDFEEESDEDANQDDAGEEDDDDDEDQ